MLTRRTLLLAMGAALAMTSGSGSSLAVAASECSDKTKNCPTAGEKDKTRKVRSGKKRNKKRKTKKQESSE
jgi:hypothetical protein